MSNEILVSRLVDAMKQKIEFYGLELLENYPNDLVVHDRAMLEKFANPGAMIAWMVGHSHTHIVSLGVHPKEQELVTCLTNLANDDRFFVIRIHSGNNFSFKEVERGQFSALANTPVPYRTEGPTNGFWLLRGAERLGHCAIERTGTMHDLTYHITITPIAGIAAAETAALTMWAEKSAVSLAGSLFVRTATTWAEPMRKAA